MAVHGPEDRSDEIDAAGVSALFDVTGKVVLVTGGARGIGRMIADGFAAAGSTVYITARRADAAEAAAAEIGAHGIAADLSTPNGTEAVVAAIQATSARLDVLVNNAGATWGAPLESYPDDAFDKVFGLNVKGAFRLVSRLAPMLKATGTPDAPARVLNIGSVDGSRVPDYEAYAYGASKAALHMLTRQLAHTLAPLITVNTIAPGPFPTKMIQHVLNDPEAKAAVESLVPMHRLGTPEDIVGAAIFLSSRAGSFVTGALLPVDGGITSK
jgi:NAD(P)-dependent dehydrogenase (short-subunit alcohol dehydrogenase family)